MYLVFHPCILTGLRLPKAGVALDYRTCDSEGKPKGNVDAELVLHSAAIEYPNYDKAVIVAGDGDYCCLLEYLSGKKKLLQLIIPNVFSESSLLKKFQEYKTFVIFEKDRLEFKQNKSGRRRA